MGHLFNKLKRQALSHEQQEWRRRTTAVRYNSTAHRNGAMIFAALAICLMAQCISVAARWHISC
jgi:hypothetical protein